MIGNLKYACIETADLAKSKAFYTEALGLKLTAEGDGWFTLDAGATTMVVWQGPNPSTILGFFQPELEAARAQLQEKGLEVGEITPHPGGRDFMLKDPDGNLIMIADD